jgi:CheY-like chemotaxis protein
MASIAIENTFYAEEREANRIKDEFLSTLSHELRTPLNAILGWTQLMRIGQLDKEAEHGMEVIERNARAQAKLVEDLLDVSRVTTGKLRLNKRSVNLWEVVTAAIDALQPSAKEKQITVEVSCEADDCCMSGDGDRLQQVAWNLLSNAIKFTPAGGRVSLRLDRVGGNLRLRVADSGHGIKPNFLPFVFDRFRQADSTSTRSYGGLGIGLTIVRHIVQLHNGTVHAESLGEGCGATFTIILPAPTGTGAPDGSCDSAASEAGSDLEAPDLQGVHVLLIDDEADAREVVGEILRRRHARVSAAGSVKEALAIIESGKPHIIISDIAMPEQDGFDFIRILRQLAPDKGGMVPAVALTAYARDEDRLRSLTAGFQAHLTKPVSPTELAITVAQLCGKQSTILAG